jgi:MFS family permease
VVVAYTVNRLGSWLGSVAIALVVFDHTHSAFAVAAMLVAAQVLPAFISPALIAHVETSEQRGSLSRLYLFEAVATLVIAFTAWHFTLPALLFVVAVDGTAALSANSLLRSEAARAAREVAPEGQDPHDAERAANAAINVAFSITFVTGPALAGVLVAAAGGATALLVDAVSFAVCGAMLLDLSPPIAAAGGSSVRERLGTALRHVNDVPSLRALLLVESVAVVFFEFAGPVEIVYAKSTLNAGDRGYGLLLASWGVGVVVGSLVYARAPGRAVGAMLVGGTLAIGAAYGGFALAPTLASACAAAFVGGLGNGVQFVAVVSTIQRLTPSSLHGLLMGGLESLSAICPVIGLSLGASLVALASARTAFAVGGAGAAAAALGFLWLLTAGPQPEVEQTPATVPAKETAGG